jgi:hypothetical protein
MKLLALSMIGTLGLLAMGCTNESNDHLIGGGFGNDSLAAGDNTQHHFQDPNTGENGITDPAQARADMTAVGSPEVAARLHSCSKITYASLGSILASRGVNTSNKTQMSAGALYTQGGAALGVANYSGRVPEMIMPSTAALSKEFDVFVAAAQEIQAAQSLTMTGCPSTQLTDTSGKFTKDGISCLMGKPATDNHVAVANDAVTVAQTKGLTVAQGQQIAIASILEAAHTCE